MLVMVSLFSNRKIPNGDLRNLLNLVALPVCAIPVLLSHMET
jgi:hypothetical protein